MGNACILFVIITYEDFNFNILPLTVSRKNSRQRLCSFGQLIIEIMANFKISGVWKDNNGVITHYAIHTVNTTGTTRAIKTAKADAVRLFNVSGNEAVTWLWHYAISFWKDGAKVEVISNSYLRTRHDGIVRDNLSHLIDYDWLG
jgi:hypothetical protein